MKATKKIVGAACALVAAVALSAGSTFAWFASNGEVTATGMQVNVKTDNAYLVIAKTSEALSAGAKNIQLTDENDTLLLPSKYETDAVYKDAAEGVKSIVSASSWYTGQGTNATDGTFVESSKENLTAFTGYVVVQNIFVSVLGSNAVENIEMTMKTSGWSDTDNPATNNDAINILILYRTVEVGKTAGDWSHVELNTDNEHALEGGKLKVNADAIDSTKYVELKVMVYVDGGHESITTSNQLNLTGIALNFGFTDGKSASTLQTPTYTPPTNETEEETNS